MAVRRFDARRVDSWTRTPSGGLRIQAFPTRVGVLSYRDAKGNVIRELRPPEEVFSRPSLDSLSGAPLTHQHPPSGEVTPDNYSELVKGHVGDAVTVADDKTHVATTVYVNDAAMVQGVETGQLGELSCGYMADLDPTPGTWQGQPYDVVQRGIRYNHLALLKPGQGRAGSSVRLRLDSQDAVRVDSDEKDEQTMSMPKIKVGDREFLADSADLQPAINAVVAAKDAAEGALAAEKTTSAGLKTKLDAAVDPKAMTAAVNHRMAVLDGVNRLRNIKGEKRLDADAAGATSSDELIANALKLFDPSFNPAGKSPEFIAGFFWAKVSDLAGDEASEPDAAGMTAPVDGVTSETPHDGGDLPPPPAPGENRQDAARARVKGTAKPDADGFVGFNRNDADTPKPRWMQPLSASKTVTK